MNALRPRYEAFRRCALSIALFAACVCGARHADAQRQPRAAMEETVKPIASGDEFFVHVVPGVRERWSDSGTRIYPSSTLTYTDRRTGEMTQLLESGTFEFPTRRVSYSQVRLLGAIADDQRLYVAAWISGRFFDKPPGRWEKRTGGSYRLQTFRLSDGELVNSLAVAEGLPDAVPDELPDPSPLQLIDGGVKCFGQTFTFNR
jgi:hypothetical protein